MVALLAGLAALQAECLAALVAERPESRLAVARAVAATAGHATGALLRARCLTMEQAAKESGVLENSLREAGRRGDLPIVHIGRYVYVRPETLAHWIAARESTT
jgi:hypothetical protein